MSDAPASAAGVKLDLNNPEFQRQLFDLQKSDASAVIGTLRKISGMTWLQFYADVGLRWEQIHSYVGPKSEKRYSFRIARGFRAVGFRERDWLRILSLHPDHDSAYDQR